jgi:hypothetical protein
MNAPAVAEYALRRISQFGIDRIFGVPGDYAFSIDDAAERVPGLSWVGRANELNAAYAADGDGRIRGAAILSTTYGVGELSAINGVMGSKAHCPPVFHWVGMPSECMQRQGSVPAELEAAVETLRARIAAARSPVAEAVKTADLVLDIGGMQLFELVARALIPGLSPPRPAKPRRPGAGGDHGQEAHDLQGADQRRGKRHGRHATGSRPAPRAALHRSRAGRQPRTRESGQILTP